MKTQDITKMALLAALLAASAYINIPLGFTPVSLTFQTLIVNIIAIMLTPGQSFLTVFVYILIGAAGVPIFAGGTGGIGRLFGPTGGYILAFMVSAGVMSFTKNGFLKLFSKLIKNPTAAMITAYSVNAILIGMTITYLLGSLYMKILAGKAWGAIFMMAVVPFIGLDLIKCIAAAMISVPVLKALNRE